MRRILVTKVISGRIDLGVAEAHHLRDVLRLEVGAEIEVFDEIGGIGHGEIVSIGQASVAVEIRKVSQSTPNQARLTIAAAIPKAGRADWMIEKLGELGVYAFVPLMTERSVVTPKGSSKQDRWHRLATEAARQSGSAWVMGIEPLMELSALVEKSRRDGASAIWSLSLAADSMPIYWQIAAGLPDVLTILVGPEGGWSTDELNLFRNAGITAVRLTGTTLRVETAAVAAAGVIQSSNSPTPDPSDLM
jgi:16S rRNA (uracil1498-N3)-methyltransferase